MNGDLFAQHGTRVVNVKTEECDVYCGRAMPNRGLLASPWANKYKLETERERSAAIQAFERDLLENPVLLVRLVELRGKRLGCWCRPKPCHCDVLARWADSPSRTLLEAHFRARRSFGRNSTATLAHADWLAFLQHHGLIPETVGSWGRMEEPEAAAALQGLAQVHAGFPRPL